MSRLSIRAILIGGAVDIVITFGWAIVLAVIVVVVDGTWKLPEAEQEAAMLATLTNAPWVKVFSVVFGGAASVFAGYAAAAIAKSRPVAHGTWAATVILPYAAWSVFSEGSVFPLWMGILLLPLGPALGALGGLWWTRSDASAASAAVAV